jgi:hypothetical protein
MAGFKQSCMQFTMKKMIASSAKWAQSGVDITHNREVSAALRNLGSRMLQNSRLFALE